MKLSKFYLLFSLVIIIGFFLRRFNSNWDGGFHLHPDERMLMMVTERINFFENLNPGFFNYGSLPLYLLRGLSEILSLITRFNFSTYYHLLPLGRFLSSLADTLTIFFIYQISLVLFPKNQNINMKIGLISAFLYSISFFPIQNSHFFISDIFLTLFSTILVLGILKVTKDFHEKKMPSGKKIKKLFFLGTFLALTTTTKFTGIIFLPLAIFFIAILVYRFYRLSFFSKIKKFLLFSLIFIFSFFISNFFFMPYAFLDYKKFISDINLQLKMNSNPYIFPYTLQYVDTAPYFYYLKNIFFWGLGPFTSILSLIGLIIIISMLIKKFKSEFKSSIKFLILIFLIFHLSYFLIIGRSAVKFMRYMLPIYPFLVILAGYGFWFSFHYLKQQSKKTYLRNKLFAKIGQFVLFLTILGSVFWGLVFFTIYLKPHTRITASHWILSNIPPGSTLAVEHWDDRLPIFGAERYNFIELNLYDLPDDEQKWLILNQKIARAEYIIIASNRLYVPLQKLTDCQKYKVCYPKTARYYQNLFQEKLGFVKIAEFFVYPEINILGLQIKINDQDADESFTVYDHPKIIIFKKIKEFNQTLQYKKPLLCLDSK